MNVAIGRNHVSVALKQDLVNSVVANRVDWIVSPPNTGWKTPWEATWGYLYDRQSIRRCIHGIAADATLPSPLTLLDT